MNARLLIGFRDVEESTRRRRNELWARLRREEVGAAGQQLSADLSSSVQRCVCGVHVAGGVLADGARRAVTARMRPAAGAVPHRSRTDRPVDGRRKVSHAHRVMLWPMSSAC